MSSRDESNSPRFDLALEAVDDGLWDWNLITGQAFFSPRYFTMLGYEPDEMKAGPATWEALLHPEDLERAKAHVAKAIEQGENFDVEFRLRTKSGDWHWVRGRGRIMLRDDQGRPMRMVGTHVDIHGRKIAEENLRQRLAELEALNSLSQATAASRTLDELIQTTLDKVLDILSPDMAIIFLKEDDRLVVHGHRNVGIQFCRQGDRTHAIGECLCGLAALHGQTLHSKDIHQDPRCARNECKEAGLSSCVAIPLKTRDATIGVLGLGTVRPCEFTDRDDFLGSVAAIVSTGIDNSSLHDRIRSHAEELEGLVRQRTEDLRLFYNAVEHSQASIVITDDQGTIEYVNPFFTALTGYSFEQAVGRNPRILQSGLHDAEFYSGMWRTLRDGRAWRGEICNRKADGSLYWEDASISPLLDEAGEIRKFVSVKEDITDRKRTEAALRESEDRYRTVVKNSQDGILVADRETRAFVFANEAVATLFGYSREDILDLTIEDIHPSEAMDEVLDSFRRLGLGEIDRVDELPCQRPDKSVFYADIRATAIDFEGRPCVMGFFRDVTERRRAAQLREDIDRILRHDLKTPLNGIINLPEIVLADGGLSPTQEEYLRLASDTGRLMLEMIESSLDMYRMESGTYDYRPEAVELREFATGLIGNLDRLRKSKGITLDIRLDGQPLNESQPVTAQAERILLFSALSNFLTNAVEAAPKYSVVSMSIQCGPRLKVTIHNQGAVPEAIRTRFFDKYVTHGKPKGSGLGTYSARLAVRTMGGDVAMTTSKKDGTTITISIPQVVVGAS